MILLFLAACSDGDRVRGQMQDLVRAEVLADVRLGARLPVLHGPGERVQYGVQDRVRDQNGAAVHQLQGKAVQDHARREVRDEVSSQTPTLHIDS